MVSNFRTMELIEKCETLWRLMSRMRIIKLFLNLGQIHELLNRNNFKCSTYLKEQQSRAILFFVLPIVLTIIPDYADFYLDCSG